MEIEENVKNDDALFTNYMELTIEAIPVMLDDLIAANKEIRQLYWYLAFAYTAIFILFMIGGVLLIEVNHVTPR